MLNESYCLCLLTAFRCVDPTWVFPWLHSDSLTVPVCTIYAALKFIKSFLENKASKAPVSAETS